MRQTTDVSYFHSLHHHSTFSYLDGFGTPEDHVAAVADLGMPAMAMTEHGNVTSHVPLEQAALAAGVKPLFGCELYTGEVDPETRSRFKWHLTVLAMDQEGYRNLLRLTSLGWAEGFYYEPTVSGQMLADHSEGLIVLSGCASSKMACDLLGGKGVEPHAADYRAAKKTALLFRELLGDRFYLEAQAFPELERTRQINQAWAQISSETGIPLVATGDIHYPKPADSEIQVLLHAIDRGGKNNTYEKQQQAWGYDIKLTAFADNVMWSKLKATGLTGAEAEAAVRTSGVIAGRLNVKLPRLKELVFPTKQPKEELFRQLLRQGWKYRGLDALLHNEKARYVERVKYEADMIELKQFVDYFLVVGDVVRWSKDNFIPVGPARGSAAASLVCWLLRITEVNPMLYPNLIFERFIDINRHDIPDIDLDFDDEQRWRIREYLVDKWGEDRVGNIGTFTRFRGKNSLTDVAKVHRLPYGDVESVKEMLIERASGDLRGSATIEDTIDMFPKVKAVFDKHPALFQATRLEGNLRGFSVHAAGLVVANEPLTNSVAVYERRDPKTHEVIGNVLSINKHDAEYINALKIDFLGLTTMGFIRICLEMIGMTLEELYAVDLNEEAVFDAFRRNEIVGVFQFDGRAMRSVNREVKPDTFAEVCDINALARPGPLHSGAAAEYIMVKHGKKKAEFLHEVVSEITARTNSQIVYQEQILQVVRRLGGFSWEEAALIRKLISKKQGEQAFNRMQQRFLDGCAGNGVELAKASKIWKQLVTAGAYAFNAAHCLVGSMMVGMPLTEAEARKGATSTQGSYITLEEMYQRVHGVLPKTVGRYAEKHDGPCVTCKTDHDPEAKYSRGQCKTCKGWRRMFLNPSRGYHVMSMDADGQLRPNRVVDIFYQGVRDCIRAELADGNVIQATPDHKVWTRVGWKELGSLAVGDELCVDDGPPARKYAGHNAIADGEYSGFGKGKNGGYASWQKWRAQAGDACELCGVTHRRLESSHKDGNRKNNDWSNLQLVCPSCHRKYDRQTNGSVYGGHHVGRNIKWVPIIGVTDIGEMPVYDLEMKAPNHNFTANNIVAHNCTSYGMLAYWTMWLKVHHPLEFYCAALQKFDPKTKGFDLLKEASARGIEIYPPDPVLSQRTWAREGSGLRTGFLQVSGIGDVTSQAILNYRESLDDPETMEWGDLINVPGIGNVTIEKVMDFANDADPFGLELLGRNLTEMRKWLWENGEAEGLPFPHSKSEDVPYEPSRGEFVWLGMVRDRNLKDLYELHRSRTGEELDPATVREPQYVNWMVVAGEDETGPLVITVHRYGGFYERYKEALWNMDVKRDLLLVVGYKRSEYRRAIYASQIYVLKVEDIL